MACLTFSKLLFCTRTRKPSPGRIAKPAKPSLHPSMTARPDSPLLVLCVLAGLSPIGQLHAQVHPSPDSLARQADSAAVSPARLQPHHFQSLALNTTIGYYAYLPAVSDSAAPLARPAVIFLHGIGERGNGMSELPKVLKWGLPRLIAHGGTVPLVVISPQLPMDQKHWPVALIDEVIAAASQTLHLDPSRIYLTGISTGAEGAWTYAVARPHAVAAIVPIAGTGSPKGICAMREVAVWAFHGGEDKDEALGHESRLVEALNACQPPPDEPARLTIYPGAGHEVWTRTYDGSGGYDIYAWLLSHHL